MSVNVSARQLTEPAFIDDVRSTLTRYSIAKDQLVLELTESLFALTSPEISAQLAALHELGIKIAMDDFGTGYSSLAYLQKLQLDILKIDKSFVDGLGDNAHGSALVNTILSLAASLQLEVVAEGIETLDQRDELHSIGCLLGQGYLYSRPLDPVAMTRLLADPLASGGYVRRPSTADLH